MIMKTAIDGPTAETAPALNAWRHRERGKPIRLAAARL
jgi:hypothetical protein